MRGIVTDARGEANGRTLLSDDQWRLMRLSLRLSARELQIVQCIFDGQIEAAIALRLGISAHTVHTYMRRLYRKLGVRDRCELLVRVFAAYLSLCAPAHHFARNHTSATQAPLCDLDQ
jgi:DNA-binding CsgD family transcriptional regulator